MNKRNAMKALVAGHRLSHTYFNEDQWVEMFDQYTIINEVGTKFSAVRFFIERPWEAGWFIIKFAKKD